MQAHTTWNLDACETWMLAAQATPGQQIVTTSRIDWVTFILPDFIISDFLSIQKKTLCSVIYPISPVLYQLSSVKRSQVFTGSLKYPWNNVPGLTKSSPFSLTGSISSLLSIDDFHLDAFYRVAYGMFNEIVDIIHSMTPCYPFLYWTVEYTDYFTQFP